MKQLLQFAHDGSMEVADVPAPAVRPGTVLVRNRTSLISAGTERTTVNFARKGLIGKALSRPDLVRTVLEKARRDGIADTLRVARTRLEEPLRLGYSCAGTVIEVGEGVTDLRPGDAVACAGQGYASHAELVCVPRNLVAPVPPGVGWETAAFTTVGAIALHALRLSGAAVGESVAVVGLGLVGLLSVGLARAAGCRVIGVDVVEERVRLAESVGAELGLLGGRDDLARGAAAATGGRGADVVLVTAASDSSAPVETAVALARPRAVVVVVGSVGMDVPRTPAYEKELTLRVSRSYGPGRYDPAYEEGGHDYPPEYVRWTENRNLEAFLSLAAEGRVDPAPLVTRSFPLERAIEAYAALEAEGGGPGVLLTYPEDQAEPRGGATRTVRRGGAPVSAAPGVVGVGLVGPGRFATGTLLPALGEVGGCSFPVVCAATGPSALAASRRFGFDVATTDLDVLLGDERVDLVVIATRHDLHAGLITAALEAGKHVFCEKPPALGPDELRAVVEAHRRNGSGRLLAVGYNRRYAELALRMREFVQPAAEPLAAHYRVDAGALPEGHWLRDPAVGGGRVVGEGCHFVDFLSFLTGSVPVRVRASAAGGTGRDAHDDVHVVLDFADGSVGALTYVESGDAAAGKERVEAFGGGRTAVLDDFRALTLASSGRARTTSHRWGRDKGHAEQLRRMLEVLRAGAPLPIPMESLVSTSLATFAVADALRTGEGVSIRASDVLDA
ncbi:MAG: bi-domain-containing oxidoreductase [Gemmatimonadota bacterium]|jgi:predicted dehydrogenase